MVHLQTIKWHDLIEDPEDLPHKTGRYMLSMCQNIHHVSFLLYPNEGLLGETDLVIYNADEKAWVVDNYEGFESLFLDYTPFYTIIAWAEPIKPYEKGI